MWIHRKRQQRPVTGLDGQFITGFIFGSDGKVVVLAAVTEDHAKTVIAIRAFVVLVGAPDFKALKFVASNKVHNPGNGVRTIQGGSTVFQDFNPTNGNGGHGADVHTNGLCGHMTATVDQHQCSCGTHAAQVNRSHTFVALATTSIKLVGFTDVARSDAEVADHLQNAGITLVFQVCAADHINGQISVFC